MARLVLEDTTYVEVALGVAGETGALKDIFAPKALVAGTLDATARRQVGRVRVYGHFGYGYTYGKGSTWRGWIDPYETPFMVADSVPGGLSLERYALQAGLALPLRGGWAAGLDLAYDVALMAKHRDLRNKNTAMNFRVAPGISWQGRRFGFGLDAGYERGTERVEYTQISENVEHVLFDLYGLWLYHSSGYASAENRRMKENDLFYGDLQLDFRFGSVSLHNNLRVDWRKGVQTEVGYNNLQHGHVRELLWSDDLLVSIGAAHAVEVSARYATMQGFRPLQRQALDPDSRIRVWVNVGDPVFCYWRRYHTERLAYTYGTSWKLTAGVENWKVDHSYTEYPQRFTQGIGTVTPFVAATVPFGQFEVSASVGFAKDYDPVCDITAWQLAGPMLRQWEYWEGDNWLAGAGLQWRSSSGRTYVRARYDMEASTEPPTDMGGSRHALSFSLGFVF